MSGTTSVATKVTYAFCKGKGAVTAPKGQTNRCPECEGTATTADSGMPCLECRGKGIVSKRLAN